MLKELNENLNSIKYPVRNEEYHNWNNEQSQGINSRVDEAKNQMRNLEYKEAKNNQSQQQEEKRI